MVDHLEGNDDNSEVAPDHQLRFWSLFYVRHAEKSVWMEVKMSQVKIGSQFLIDHPELLE